KVNAGGMRDGEAVIDILADHPSTARFISTKLVRRFVSDDPPANLVRHIGEVYRKTDGDIRDMMRAIVTSKEFQSRDAIAAKTKTPFEYVVSAIRSLDGTTDGSRPVVQAIARMGQPLYQCQPPRSEEHTSELQSLTNLVCRLLLHKTTKSSTPSV